MNPKPPQFKQHWCFELRTYPLPLQIGQTAMPYLAGSKVFPFDAPLWFSELSFPISIYCPIFPFWYASFLKRGRIDSTTYSTSCVEPESSGRDYSWQGFNLSTKKITNYNYLQLSTTYGVIHYLKLSLPLYLSSPKYMDDYKQSKTVVSTKKLQTLSHYSIYGTLASYGCWWFEDSRVYREGFVS